MREDTLCNPLDGGQAGKKKLAAITDTHTHTHTHTPSDYTAPRAQSSEASSICDSSKSLADIDLVPRLAAHSGRVELSGAAGRSWDHSRRRRLRPWAETHSNNPLLGLTMSRCTPSQSQHRQRQINTGKHTHMHTCMHSPSHSHEDAALNAEWERGQRSVRGGEDVFSLWVCCEEAED